MGLLGEAQGLRSRCRIWHRSEERHQDVIRAAVPRAHRGALLVRAPLSLPALLQVDRGAARSDRALYITGQAEALGLRDARVPLIGD